MNSLKRRRSYLLLEVLIAMFLVALVAVPMLRPAIAILRDEALAVEQLRNDRRLNNAHVKLIEQLYRNTIPWDTIDHKSIDDSAWQWMDPSDSNSVKYRFAIKREKHQHPSRHLVVLQLETGKERYRLAREYWHFIERQGGVTDEENEDEEHDELDEETF